MQNELDAKLIGEAIAGLDEILDRHAFGFVHLDRPALIERLERIRETALATKLVLEERRRLWVGVDAESSRPPASPEPAPRRSAGPA